MRKVIMAVIMLAMAASLCLAQETTVTITGYIIDNMCAGASSASHLKEFVKGHTKECALAPDCAASGYSFVTDGKVMKFDAGSNAIIIDFLKAPENTLRVEIEAVEKDGILSIVSINNI